MVGPGQVAEEAVRRLEAPTQAGAQDGIHESAEVEAANDAAVNDKIENATGVWLSVVDVDNFEKIVSETKLETSLTALIKRGGAIGTSAAACVRRMLPNSLVKAVSAENAAEDAEAEAPAEQPSLAGIGIHHFPAMLTGVFQSSATQSCCV
mgnify:CR=1 FL=1